MTVKFEKTSDSKAYLIGGGIAGLASATYLVQEGFNPKNIYIIEALEYAGGALDAHGTPETGYLGRGARMFDEEAYSCLLDLLSKTPSIKSPALTVKEEMIAFSKANPTDSHARLVNKEHAKLDVTHFGFNIKDTAQFDLLLVIPEHQIDNVKINEYFSADFFKTNFWYMYCTTFAFQPWHSLIELKRYMKRFFHETNKFSDLSGVWRSSYNQYDSFVVPIEKHLTAQGVNFVYNTLVASLNFTVTDDYRAVDQINLTAESSYLNGTTIKVSEHDLVFTTLGSLTAGSNIGNTHTPPRFDFEAAQKDPSWLLWKDIAKRQPDFGRPEVFCGQPPKSAFVSYSVTFKNPAFFNRMIEFSKNKPGNGGLVTLVDSPWFISVVLFKQPHFANQPENVQFCWGYGLNLVNEGSFIKKKMSECTGEEILQELCYQLGFMDILADCLKDTIVKPALLPFTMAQFMPRKHGDRPLVVPSKAKNFAFLGQFVEVPDDVVFTVEYSVRCAQTAVYHYLNPNQPVTPIYKGWLVPSNLIKSAKAVIR